MVTTLSWPLSIKASSHCGTDLPTTHTTLLFISNPKASSIWSEKTTRSFSKKKRQANRPHELFRVLEPRPTKSTRRHKVQDLPKHTSFWIMYEHRRPNLTTKPLAHGPSSSHQQQLSSSFSKDVANLDHGDGGSSENLKLDNDVSSWFVPVPLPQIRGSKRNPTTKSDAQRLT
jgi:hypothetical protein